MCYFSTIEATTTISASSKINSSLLELELPIIVSKGGIVLVVVVVVVVVVQSLHSLLFMRY